MQKALVMQKSANKWQIQLSASVPTVENEQAFAKSWKQNSCANLKTVALCMFSWRKETWCLWMAESVTYQSWTGNLALLHLFPQDSQMRRRRDWEEEIIHICLHGFMHLKNIPESGLLLRKSHCIETVPQQSSLQKYILEVLLGLVY